MCLEKKLVASNAKVYYLKKNLAKVILAKLVFNTVSKRIPKGFKTCLKLFKHRFKNFSFKFNQNIIILLNFENLIKACG